ncbi:MAG: AsmA family protein [Bryobacteraceae bacterium]
MKKALIGLGVVVALLAGVAVLLLTLDVNQFKPQIEAQLQKSLKRSVSLGTISLKLIPLALRIENVTIGESPALRSARPFVTAREIQVRAGLMALLQKKVDVQSLVLVEPAVELIRSERGAWNFSDMGGGDSKSGSTGGGSLGLDRLEISDGKLAVTDLEARSPRTVYDHIDMTLSGYAPGQKFDLDAKLRLPGSGSVSVTGTGGPVPSTAFTGTVKATDVSLAGVRGLLGTGKLDADATINAEAKLSAVGDATNIEGTLTAKDVRYGDMKMGQTVDVAYRVVSDGKRKTTQIPMLQVKSGEAVVNAVLAVLNGEVSGTGTIANLSLPVASLTEPILLHNAAFRLDPGAAKVDNMKVSVGKINASGSASVRNFTAPAVQFAVDVDQIDSAEIDRLTASGGGKTSKSSAPSKITGSGTVHIGTIKYNNLLLTNVTGTCSLDRGLIRLAPISAQSSGGHVTGEIQLDGRQEPARVSVATKLDRVDANQLISSATSVKDLISGLLSGDTQAEFLNIPGGNPAKSLNGTVKFQLTDGKLQKTNVLNELANVGKFLGSVKQSQSFTTIVKLAGSMLIKNGVGTTDDLKMDIEGGSVAAAGVVNLVDQTLNLHVTAVLNKEMAQRAGSGQIAGLLSTVLSNQQGELVIPALVTGTISQPRFVPDAERFAQMKLKSLLPSTSNPAGAVGSVRGLVEALRGQKPTANQPAGQEQKQPVDSIIDLFRKKQADKPPQK